MHHHFLAIALTFFSVALVAGVSHHGFHEAVGQIYGRLFLAGFGIPTAAQLEVLSVPAREGARWAQCARNEASMWAVVLLVVGVALIAYHAYWSRRM